MTNTQIELISTGICRGKQEISTEELSEKTWRKYKTDGTPLGERVRTSPEDIYSRLGINSRPHASLDQDHTTMFNQAIEKAIEKAGNLRHSVRDNVFALFTGGSNPLSTIPRFLDEVCEYTGLHQNHHREYLERACATFNSGVHQLKRYAEDNPKLEGYAIVGSAEIISRVFKEDNFDSMMFGDMAGAAIFKITYTPEIPEKNRRILGNVSIHKPDLENGIISKEGKIYLDGKRVTEIAPQEMVNLCVESVKQANFNLPEINQFIIHPGSRHVTNIIKSKMKRAYGPGFNPEIQLPHYLEDSGNNGGVTTLNTLHRQIESGKIKPEDRIALSALGKGYYASAFVINGFPNL